MNNLRALRKRQGLAQYGLAALARVSPSLVSAIERWDFEPGLTVQERIAAALNVGVEEIWPTVPASKGESDGDRA